MTRRLPRPIGRQKEVLALPAEGHTVVLGTAGSGKTTLAILRALYLAHPDTDHTGRTLLVTFNRCLVSYLESLAGQIPDQLEVRNYHRFARGYLSQRGKMARNAICGPDLQRRLCATAIASIRDSVAHSPILDRSLEFLVEEFQWLAQHGVSDRDKYVDEERVGRTGTRVVREQRPMLYRAYEEYKRFRAEAGRAYDWDDLPLAVLEETREDAEPRYYRHIVIDEGQDFSPVMLRSLAASVPEDGSLTFFGDMAQQIYGHRMSWRSAGLKIPEAWKFKENYRNTRQIARLALAIAELPCFPADPDLIEPISPTADGPPPALISFKKKEDELPFIFAKAANDSRTETVAILFRDRAHEHIIQSLPLTPPPVRLHREIKNWPRGPSLFFGTYHSAKGLEFDRVYLPLLSKHRLPHPRNVEALGEEEARARDARLLYVAVTRAKSNLLLSYSGEPTELLPRHADLYLEVRR